MGDDSGSTLSHAPSPATRQATRAHTASALDAAVATARVSRNCAFFEAGTAPSVTDTTAAPAFPNVLTSVPVGAPPVHAVPVYSR